MSLPDWVEPVARYMFQEGLKGTLRIAVISVVASAVIGIVLGTLLTIKFWPTRALIRGYIEVWRGLPIIVTMFIIFFALPSLGSQFEFDPFTAGASCPTSAGLRESEPGLEQPDQRRQPPDEAEVDGGEHGQRLGRL